MTVSRQLNHGPLIGTGAAINGGVELIPANQGKNSRKSRSPTDWQDGLGPSQRHSTVLELLLKNRSRCDELN